MTSAYESGNVPAILVQHRLRIAREFAHLEQVDLAEKIGVSRTTIGNAETGRVKPRKITLNAWALACGVPVTWLIAGDQPNAAPPDDGGREPVDQPNSVVTRIASPGKVFELRPTG